MEDTTQESGEQSVESTSSSEPASPAQAPQDGSGQEAAATAEKPTPFHEHPRFKELIEQNRSYKSALDQQAQSVSQLQAQLQRLMQEREQAVKQTQVDPNSKIIERLKGIDPEFASFQEAMYRQIAEAKQAQQELQELRQWRQAQETQSYQQTAESTLKSLYDQHKIPESDRLWYENAIKAEAVNNPNLKLSDLPNVFKSVHDNWTKYQTERERKLRESYVADKTKDKTPAPTTGGTPASQKPKTPQSTEERIAFVRDELRRAKQKV